MTSEIDKVTMNEGTFEPLLSLLIPLFTVN